MAFFIGIALQTMEFVGGTFTPPPMNQRMGDFNADFNADFDI